MSASAFIFATLLVGQTAPFEQPPVMMPSASPADERQYQSAADESPSPVVVAGLGVPLPTAPAARVGEGNAAAPFSANRSPALAPVAPLAIPNTEDDNTPRRQWEAQPPRSRTVHTVEPEAMSPAQPATTNSSLAAALIDRALTAPREKALHGRPLTLTEALSAASSSRRDVVRRYWECTLYMAEYHSALDEYARLAALPAPQNGEGRGLLTAAQAAAKARADEAELAACSAQYDLSEALSDSFGSAPPLPTETPLVAAYRTQFEALFGDRTAPAGMKRIHETLPLVHRAVHSRAEAVVAAEDAAGAQDEAYRRGTAELHHVLAAHVSMREERHAFFETVLDYNSRIAQYALGVAGTENPNTLVTTLVENPALSATSASRSVLVRNSPDMAPATSAAPFLASPAAEMGNPAWQNREATAPTIRTPAREAQIPGFDGGRWK